MTTGIRIIMEQIISTACQNDPRPKYREKLNCRSEEGKEGERVTF